MHWQELEGCVKSILRVLDRGVRDIKLEEGEHVAMETSSHDTELTPCQGLWA